MIPDSVLPPYRPDPALPRHPGICHIAPHILLLLTSATTAYGPEEIALAIDADVSCVRDALKCLMFVGLVTEQQHERPKSEDEEDEDTAGYYYTYRPSVPMWSILGGGGE